MIELNVNRRDLPRKKKKKFDKILIRLRKSFEEWNKQPPVFIDVKFKV